MNGGGGLSCVVGQLVFSYLDIACIIITNVLTCRDSCKHRSSLVTWLAFVMVSFSCLGWLVSGRLYSLFATSTAQLSVNRSFVFICHAQTGLTVVLAARMKSWKL
ncbi:hypothetical protein QVD17_37117 [Tagetes erecta]|uniref:Uncharacterized protein n=1 Tax=Tagetes erecta TaxID=13708 RepID=A0AAD8NCH3_TARER|nr:hypothetical protein QVD17_37117 [Tagetes erecta]